MIGHHGILGLDLYSQENRKPELASNIFGSTSSSLPSLCAEWGTFLICFFGPTKCWTAWLVQSSLQESPTLPVGGTDSTHVKVGVPKSDNFPSFQGVGTSLSPWKGDGRLFPLPEKGSGLSDSPTPAEASQGSGLMFTALMGICA